MTTGVLKVKHPGLSSTKSTGLKSLARGSDDSKRRWANARMMIMMTMTMNLIDN